MKTVNKKGTVHEVVMSYYDESMPFEKIDIDQVVEGLDENSIYSEFLINPKIFKGNENYIVASNDLEDLDCNIASIEGVKSLLTSKVRNELKTVLDACIPRFPSNPESRYISVFVATYPNVPIAFEINDSELNEEKLVYSTSNFNNTLDDILFNTLDNYEFLNAVIYDGELVDIKMGNQTELDGVEFFIYDTETNSRVVEKSGVLVAAPHPI